MQLGVCVCVQTLQRYRIAHAHIYTPEWRRRGVMNPKERLPAGS